MKQAIFSYVKIPGRSVFRPENDNAKLLCKIMRRINLTEAEFDFFSQLYEMKINQKQEINEKYKVYL